MELLQLKKRGSGSNSYGINIPMPIYYPSYLSRLEEAKNNLDEILQLCSSFTTKSLSMPNPIHLKLVLRLILFLTITTYFTVGYCQSPITGISTSTANVATVTENPINGAGYSFSNWVTAGTSFTVNYASAASADITSITTVNTAAFSGMLIVPVTAIAKVQRVANTAIPDNRNFITSWNKISSGPLAAATTGTFNCVAPKVASMEAALLTNNINSGYDNTFQNTTASPHYNNIERVDYIIPAGIKALTSVSEIGFTVFDRGVGDDFKIAAITSIDGSNNPTGYGSLVTVAAVNFSAAGLLGTAFDYTIFISDPNVAAGQHRPSTRNTQDIRGVFISFQNMGIAVNQKIYGYSLFGQDVVTPTHTLTDPATFPTNTNFGSVLDLVNVMGVFKTNNVVLPVKLISFTAGFENNAVKLNWATSFEENLLRFTIEKSSDGIQWNELTSVNSSNAPTGSQYQFTDREVYLNKYYYRIKLVHRDGSTEYSKTVIASTNKPGTTFVRYNNFSNSLLVYSGKKISQVKVLSVNGQLIQSKQLPNNITTSEIPLKKLLPGIYIVHVDLTDGDKYNSKIIIQ